MDLIRDGKQATRPFFGRMNMFIYAPKFAKKLPYYDTFPLVLPLERYSDGFLGINLHYLPIPLRIGLLDRLVDFSNNEKFDETTVLDLSYSTVKSIRAVKPTIHKYLSGYVRSRFRRIDADEFTIATLLPVQRFKKASANEVWKESRENDLIRVSLETQYPGSAFGVLNELLGIVRGTDGIARQTRYELYSYHQVVEEEQETHQQMRWQEMANLTGSNTAREVSLKCDQIEMPGRNMDTAPDNNIYGSSQRNCSRVVFCRYNCTISIIVRFKRKKIF